ncbi:D-beta-hydroxybutyrate dehydrogenase, mitochondrial [Hippoglossus hippoglossus]|uniref:D-beta-hydroxybutyrate dehydrogenase, mitochondrial n=1 Tax=Hippoglossus hippoglossus TaxID=8267 RepID=UPI00148B3D2F|nr:D-beta-hydroxybutyrate dehydrogenase, mitochondrial [Hippoglossus hippoglossus]XP_034998724.1 D-beta-hydroxybutyrate dehydrogenase, mitochondrial [Hippoglossus stenolepis]
MAPQSVFRGAALVLFSVFLTVLLGLGLPALLNALMRLLGFPDSSVTECVVVVYAGFVLFVATPRIPRGLEQVSGRAVFITGCDSGFGHALAKHLHRLGFTVFAGCFLKDKGGEGAKELEEFHSDRMKLVQLDVCSEEQVNQAVEFIKENLEDSERGLWAVVNNAGVSTFGEVEFTSMDTYKKVSEVNLWGTIRVTKAVLPLIRRAKGRVVNLASLYGRMGNVMRSPYCVSKYGVEAFSDCLRYEMKSWGVKVSIVEPGNFIPATSILTRDIVASTANKLWSEAPSIVKDDYGKAHFEQHTALMRSFCSSGLKSMAPVLDDITDAIMSKHPYARYCPSEPHWWIRLQLMTHLPTAVSDLLYF